jgi:PAS domain S-box-containing protein
LAIADVAAWFPGEPDVISTLTNAAERRRPTRLQGRRANGVPFTLAIEVGLDEQSGWLVCTGREVAGEDLLSESQRYLDVAFEVAPVGMALFDTDGRYVRVNDALCRLLGRSKADLIGRRDQEFTHPEDRQADVDAAWRILNGELDVWQTEKRFLTASGDIVWTIANLTFLRDAEECPP